MISLKQVHFVEDHWNAIARRALARIRHEVPHSEAIPDRTIMDRVEDLFKHLGDWLTEPDPKQLAEFEEFGRVRAHGSTSLHALVRMLQVIRQSAMDYVRENELRDDSITLRAENELEYKMDGFFDMVIYHAVKGYEQGLNAQKPLVAMAHTN